jgi:hypothetical protein
LAAFTIDTPGKKRHSCRLPTKGSGAYRSGWVLRTDSLRRSGDVHSSLGRIESEFEPPNLATEKNTGNGVFDARNPQSPVRIREGLTAKTPRNRGDFSGCARVRAGSLCNSRLNGGGHSLARTRLSSQIPDCQGIYRDLGSSLCAGFWRSPALEQSPRGVPTVPSWPEDWMEQGSSLPGERRPITLGIIEAKLRAVEVVA